jgi:hypothetical protein
VELSTGQALSEETRSRAIEALHALVVADRIDSAQFERAVAELLQVRTEAELAELLRSLPPASAMTPAERRRDGPLKLGGGFGRLRIEGRWSVARQTSISVELGSVTVDLTDAELHDRVVDLKVYTGWGAIRIIAPPGLGIEVVRHRGRVISRIGPPTPGLPLVRLTALTNIGRTHLIPAGSERRRRRPRSS